MKKFFLLFFLCITVIFIFLIFLFSTNIGTNLIFLGVTYYIPGLTFASVSGSWGNFEIICIKYFVPTEGVIKIDKCNVLIDFKKFFLKQIYVKHFFLQDSLINVNLLHFLDSKIENIKKNNFFNIFFKDYAIIFENIVLNNTYLIFDNVEFQCQKLSTGLFFKSNLLKILPVYMHKGSILCRACINDDSSKKCNLYHFPNFWLKNLSFIECAFKKIINNKLIRIRKFFVSKNFILTSIQGKNFQICYDYDSNWHVINTFKIQTIWNANRANVKLFVDFPKGCLNGIGDIAFDNNYAVNVVVNYIKYRNFVPIVHDEYKKDFENIKLVIKGSLRNELFLDFNFLDCASSVCILMKVKLMHVGMPIELSIIGKRIPVFLFGKNEFILEKFNICLNGTRSHYFIQMYSELMRSDTGIAYIYMNAQGNDRSCVISELKAKTVYGSYEIKGIISWRDVISWNTVLIFNKINFLKKYLKYPIELSGKAFMKGSLCIDSWELMVSQCYVYGNYRNKNIMCKGSIHIQSDGQWNIPMFVVNCGENFLEIQGKMKCDRILDAIVKLHVINFADLPCELSGSMYFDCKLYGLLESLSILLNMKVQSLIWKDKNINIKDMLISSNIYFDNSVQSTFLLKVNQIQYKNLLLCNLCIAGQGNFLFHNFNVVFSSQELCGSIKLIGQYDVKNKFWTGQINKTHIHTVMGTWKLTQDMILIYYPISCKIILKAHCWENSHCIVNMSSPFQRKFFDGLQRMFKNFDFISINPILIEKISIYDMRICCKDLYWIPDYLLPKGSVLFSGEQLIVETYDEKKLPVKINHLDLKVELTHVGFFCNFIFLFNNNKISSKFLITNLYSIPEISGNIQCVNIDLTSFLKLFLNDKNNIQGLLDINLNFQGCLNNPKIYGYVILKDCSFNAPNLPVFIEKSVLKINFLGNRIVLDGFMNTENGGHLYLNGNVDNFFPIRYANAVLNIYGNHVDVNISPTILMRISPNFICRISIDKIDIAGNVNIPWARIELQKYSKDIIKIVPEEIILDCEYNPILNDFSKKFNFFSISKIVVHFGHDVNFHGFGLEVKLYGDLDIVYHENDLCIIGQIGTSSGYLRVYGTNLMIKQGQLLFSGSINQAYLDIEAIKRSFIKSDFVESIVSGVRITGPLDQLKLDFFSNLMSLSKQEIASSLFVEDHITLFNINNINNKIASLLVRLSMKKYEKLVNKIGKFLGVQDLTLNTQDFGSNSLVVLSGYIIPGLKIKYGVNIFDLLTTITIRYCLNQKLYLEASSKGGEQTVDLLYKFDV